MWQNYPHQSPAYRWDSSKIFLGSCIPTEQPTMLPIITIIRVKVKVQVIPISDPSSESGFGSEFRLEFISSSRSESGSESRSDPDTDWDLSRIQTRTSTRMHGAFSATADHLYLFSLGLRISTYFQRLTNNYFQFVGHHVGLATSGSIRQHFRLLKTDWSATKLLRFDIVSCLNRGDSGYSDS